MTARYRIRQARGWEAVVWGAIGLPWAWSCTDLRCDGHLFGTWGWKGSAVSQQHALELVADHDHRFHRGTL